MPSIPTKEFIKDKKRFEAWRAQRPRGSAIPDRLWKLAASHVNEYGLNKVSREFGVNYSKLKEKTLALNNDTLTTSLVEPALSSLLSQGNNRVQQDILQGCAMFLSV